MDISLQVYTGIWEDVKNFDTTEEAFKYYEELPDKNNCRLCFPDEILRTLSAKEWKAWQIPKDAVFIGSVMRPYGDEYYYRLADGTFVYEYFSIGD